MDARSQAMAIHLGDPSHAFERPRPDEKMLWTHAAVRCAVRADEVLHVVAAEDALGFAGVDDAHSLSFLFSDLKLIKTRSLARADRDDAFHSFINFATRRAHLRGDRGLWTHRDANYAIRADAVSCLLSEDVPNFDGQGIPGHFLTFRLTDPHVLMHRYADPSSRDAAFHSFIEFANLGLPRHS